MRKDIYISSVLVRDKCIYACTSVKGDNMDTKVGELHVRRPNKACMYATDIMLLQNREEKDLIFHYNTPEALKYVNEMRKVRTCVRSPFVEEPFEINNRELKNYISEKYPHYKNVGLNMFLGSDGR